MTRRDELADSAGPARCRLQEHLRSELMEEAAYKPSVEQLLDRVRERKATTHTCLSIEVILEYREVDRQ